jgi:hypothetical protein
MRLPRLLAIADGYLLGLDDHRQLELSLPVYDALSQMDVPTRQAYVMAVVDPGERTAAAAYTNTARYLTRPVGALIAGPIAQVALGGPFVIAGVVKSVYDVGLYRVCGRVALSSTAVTRTAREEPSSP